MFTILIVEDNEAFRLSLKEILMERFPSVTVREASDSQTAMALIDLYPPDVILMDVGLPGETGFALTARIKTHYRHIPIVMLSHHTIEEYREAAMSCGADEFFSKDTMTGDEIARWVESVIDRKRGAVDCHAL